MNKNSKIYLAGHTGLVGSAILGELARRNYCNIITKTHRELDLTNQEEVNRFFKTKKPEYVFLAAAKVGGINANNTYKADFIYINTSIALNVIHSAYKYGVKKLLNMGSSCIYPKYAEQPIKEESLLTGKLEPTNEPYAIAKITAIKMCRYYNEQYGTNFISTMPTNLYGPNDNFDLVTSHVLPALLRKIHEAKINKTPVTLWGDGTSRREFLYVEDLANAAVFLMEKYSYLDIGEFINIGTGLDVTIKELAEIIAGIVEYNVSINWDRDMPNGTPRKVLDVRKINGFGWEPKTGLTEGIKKTYDWYLDDRKDGRKPL